jgi:diguanylate cyclase (GGDEF)-like protein
MITSRIAQKHRDYAAELGVEPLPGQAVFRRRTAAASVGDVACAPALPVPAGSRAAGHRRPGLSLFPLATDRDTCGVLEIRTPVALTAEQRRLVSSILRVYRNFQGLLDYSERDTLTGLLNRKTFDGSFLRVASMSMPPSRQRRAAATTCVAPAALDTAWLGVVDIDHFKSVNDNHGHLIGDEVLLLVARLMRSSFRFQDQLYRFGGEEFVVLIRCGTVEQAHAAFERLRSNIESYIFPRVGRITVSVGFTQLRTGDSPSGAFERADKAVYHAKQNGRNQVAHHGDLIARGVFVEEARTGDMELF